MWCCAREAVTAGLSGALSTYDHHRRCRGQCCSFGKVHSYGLHEVVTSFGFDHVDT